MSSSFLKDLAQARPDPGGGAAAAHGAALGMALLEKAARLELQRPNRPAAQRVFWADLVEQVVRIAHELTRLQDEDVRAYFQLTRARASGNPEEMQAALEEAVSCPQRIMDQAHEGLKLAARIGEKCKKHLISDLLVACEFLAAAVQGAYHIACANLALIKYKLKHRALARELAGTFRPACECLQKVKVDLVVRAYGADPGR